MFFYKTEVFANILLSGDYTTTKLSENDDVTSSYPTADSIQAWADIIRFRDSIKTEVFENAIVWTGPHVQFLFTK